MQSLGLPFALKAGTIGSLQIKVNYFQMWARNNASIEITVSDLFLILGPNLVQRSHDESFCEQEEDGELMLPYDPSNMYDIFANQLQIKNTGKKRDGKFATNHLCGRRLPRQ